MNCEQANRMDLAGYLSDLGHSPAKVRGNNCWYHSPLHADKTPSFKVDRAKNTWYDFSLGKGGTLVDFVCALHSCNIAIALHKIESKEPRINLSFPQQKGPDVSDDNRIKILQVSGQFTDMVLRRYLNQRNIPKEIAEKFCKQVTYQTGEKRYSAIGFKNNAGGYELRSP
ncbi:MAG: CHC2 zinc finger domain-containing protein, partial [Sediminibacterium sp.]